MLEQIVLNTSVFSKWCGGGGGWEWRIGDGCWGVVGGDADSVV